MSDSRIRAAAREALDAHDALRAGYVVEPPSNEEGIPIDPASWMTWWEAEAKPAYDRWAAAMDELSDALSEPNMSRHPSNFRPRCEAILSGEVATQRER